MCFQAIGVQPSKNGGVVLSTKKTKHLNRPAANINEVSWGGNKSGPKLVMQYKFYHQGHASTYSLVSRIYKGIVNQTAKQGYRADLRQEAVARASAIRQSQRPKKDLPEKKARGRKAKDAQ